MNPAQARILVVDDAPRNVKLLADVLTASGYDVVTAASGAEALERIARDRPDLVLLDVVMPGMTGYDVCRSIRANPATTILPVVMVTALDASVERVNGLESGADDFLSKPINQAELLARVRSLLRIKQLHDTVGTQAAQLAEWNERLKERVAEQVHQLERLGTLKRFLPPQVADRIVAGGADDPLTTHRREIVVVAIELRGFTTFAESGAPEEVMAALQELHHVFGRVVVEYEGTLERFTGEGVVVFFNDPVPQPDAAERAVRMALGIRERAAEITRRWSKRGVALDVAVGIAQGYATLGAIGFEARSDYTAIGVVPSLALRLAEAAEGGEILISQRVLAAVDSVVESEPKGEQTLKGFSRPVAVFRLRALATGAGAAEPPDAARTLRREGEYWSISFDGESSRLRDSKGLHYIAHLLRHPEHDFHALDLVALTRNEASDVAPPPLEAGETEVGGLGDAGTVLDSQAKETYRRRLDVLRSELAEAESFGDTGRIARLQSEIGFLSTELASAVGLGGRDRRVGASAERARVNVTRAIADALKRMREHCPRLTRHLEASIRTGTFCTYKPADTASGGWQL